jgi:hypothetical protein
MKAITRFPKSWLPNQSGFKFRAIKIDGSVQVCVVQKDDTGLHYVRGVKWEDIKEWEYEKAR